ncbi:hypothetical protein [uncultured Mediterranean phage uvMED]|nr:hypothetical protein [uncultured Mediterranean phage uvMED]|tara:strand:+ start:4926 stop:5294 length:369 start_codon:yes stop_codon:yes gene_type:complete
MITRDQQVVAVGQTTANFDSNGWTTIDLSTVPANMTTLQPGADIASILIENKHSSSASAYVVYRNDVNAMAATDGFEIEPGGVLGEGQVKNMRYISVRSTADSGTIKLVIRSYRDANASPWS